MGIIFTNLHLVEVINCIMYVCIFITSRVGSKSHSHCQATDKTRQAQAPHSPRKPQRCHNSLQLQPELLLWQPWCPSYAVEGGIGMGLVCSQMLSRNLKVPCQVLCNSSHTPAV